MAGVKNINVISGTGNPVQMQDLQNLWSVINTLCTAKSNSVTVLAGMKTKTVGSETVFEAGIIFYQGQAYYLADSAAKPGQYLYVASQPSDQRIYEDGTTRYMYTDYLVNVSSSATATGIGTLIGQATTANVAQWQTSYISPASITSALLQDNSVTTPKISNNAVTGNKIAPFSISNDHIEDASIYAFQKLVYGSVSQEIMGVSSVGTTQLIDKSVTTEKIADGAITNTQIARATIEGVKLVPKTISDSNIADGGVVTDNIEDGAVTTDKLFPGAVDSGVLGLNSVLTRHIDNGAVTAPKLADEAVTHDKFASGTIVNPTVRRVHPNVTSVGNNITTNVGDFIYIEGTNGVSYSANIDLPPIGDVHDYLCVEILCPSSPATITFTSVTSSLMYSFTIAGSTGGAHFRCYKINSLWIVVGNSLLNSVL